MWIIKVQCGAEKNENMGRSNTSSSLFFNCSAHRRHRGYFFFLPQLGIGILSTRLWVAQNVRCARYLGAFGIKNSFVPSKSSNFATGPKKALNCVLTFSHYFLTSTHPETQNWHCIMLHRYTRYRVTEFSQSQKCSLRPSIKMLRFNEWINWTRQIRWNGWMKWIRCTIWLSCRSCVDYVKGRQH